MAISTIDGVESIRILRASGNLKIAGTDRPAIEIDSGVAPRVTTNAGVAEVTLRDNASIAVPAGVTVEVEDLAGNLDVSNLATPFAVTRVRGNLHARHIGAISMRDTVSGNVSIKEAGAVDGIKVRGGLSVESAGAITFSHIAGAFDCRAIDGEVAIEKIAGSANLLGVHAPFIARVIGGHLEIEDAAHVEAGVVGGRVRASNLSGGLQIGKIGGKLAADSVAGEVAIGFVGGNARISRVARFAESRRCRRRYRSQWSFSARQGLERRQPRPRQHRGGPKRVARARRIRRMGSNPHLRHRRSSA